MFIGKWLITEPVEMTIMDLCNILFMKMVEAFTIIMLIVATVIQYFLVLTETAQSFKMNFMIIDTLRMLVPEVL